MSTGWAGICRYGGVGDNLIVSSVFKPLREKYGHLEVITQVPQHVVFENNPYIDKLAVHKPGEVPGGVIEWKQWHDVRAKEYDLFVNLSHSVETLVALLPGQTQSSWPVEWRRRFCGKSYVQVAAEIVGVDPAACMPEFFPKEEETLKARETLNKVRETSVPGRPVIAWVVSGTRIDKIYPASTITVARLIQEVGAHVILFGAPGRDFEMARGIEEYVKRANGSTSGLHAACDSDFNDQKWPIRRILATIRECDLVISPDTGPAWSVAACPVPKIMMVSHASSENITKGWINTITLHADIEKVPCWPCHRLHDDLSTCTPDPTGAAAACISSITPTEIIASTVRLLHPETIQAAEAFASRLEAAKTSTTVRPNGHDASPGDQGSGMSSAAIEEYTSDASE